MYLSMAANFPDGIHALLDKCFISHFHMQNTLVSINNNADGHVAGGGEVGC